MSINWKDKKEELRKLVIDDKLSYIAIGKIYGVSDGAIRKACFRFNLDVPARRNVNPSEQLHKRKPKTAICKHCGKEFVLYLGTTGTFCSLDCFYKDMHKRRYLKIINGDKSIMRANYTPKEFKKDIINEQNGVCAICGCGQVHNGKPLVFILDHIDGNAANNKRNNLRCICPNCDSQLDTYKSKNKNGARHYYRYHKEKIIK